MKKRFSKLTALCLTGAMTAALLAGCGGSGNSETSDSDGKRIGYYKTVRSRCNGRSDS